jgi:hypothetical protein
MSYGYAAPCVRSFFGIQFGEEPKTKLDITPCQSLASTALFQSSKRMHAMKELSALIRRCTKPWMYPTASRKFVLLKRLKAHH